MAAAVPRGGPLTPNFTPVPDLTLDFWMASMTGAEWKVVCYVMRHTYGWQKPLDRLSVPQICNGIKRRDGTRVDMGTGLSDRQARTAIHSLVGAGVLHRTGTPRSDGGDQASLYGLVLDADLTRLDRRLKTARSGEEYPCDDCSPPPAKIAAPPLQKLQAQDTESQEIDKAKAEAEAEEPYSVAGADSPPRAPAHEEPAAALSPLETRLAALRSAPAADPSPTPTEPSHAAPDPAAAPLLAAFDRDTGEGNDYGSKGGECCSEAAPPLCPLEEILEDLMQIELEEDLDDFPDDPRTPPSPPPDPPPAKEFTPRDDTEGARLLVARGVAHDIAEQIGEEHNLSRVRDVCELAGIKGWNAGTLVRCFTAGWDREPANRRKLAAARGLPASDPKPSPRPAARHPTPEFEPADEGYLRHLRGQLTPEERQKNEEQLALLKEQMASLFPERSRPDGSRKTVVPPAPDPVPAGASDPRPIAEIMAKPEYVAPKQPRAGGA